MATCVRRPHQIHGRTCPRLLLSHADREDDSAPADAFFSVSNSRSCCIRGGKRARPVCRAPTRPPATSPASSFPAAASNWTGHTAPVTSLLRFTNRTMASRHSENNAQGAVLLTTPHTNISRIIHSFETRWPTLSVRQYATLVWHHLAQGFGAVCEGRCPGDPQWQHVLQYWEESVRRPDRVLFLRYEEMLLEPESHLKKLAKFMDCEFSEEEEEGGVVSAIVELCSLGKLKDMEVNTNRSSRLGINNESYFRKGVSGDWSNHMTREMAQRLGKVVEDALQGTGFTFASTS